jgi:hypothetical protein
VPLLGLIVDIAMVVIVGWLQYTDGEAFTSCT